MVINFFIFLSSSSVIASIVALYVLIFGTFEKKEKKEEKSEPDYIKKDTRTIKAPKSDEVKIQKTEGLNTQADSLIWTVISGQLVGLYFLFMSISGTETAYRILKLNAFSLLLASFICSILTMLNGCLKKKMEIQFRLLFQGYSLGVAIILFRLGVRKGVTLHQAIVRAGAIPDIIVYGYFLTVVVALSLMLLVGSSFQRQESMDFNFNIYFLIVVFVGMFVGLGLKIALSIF